MNMKSINAKAAMMALAMVATMGTTACSDDNDGPSQSQVEEQKVIQMSDITERYVDYVVYITYDRLASASETLYDQVGAMRTSLAQGSLTQTQIDQTCATFLKARAWWEKSEAWLYGPAENWGIDPHIDTWPLSRPGLAKFLSNNKDGIFAPGFDIDEAIEAVSENNREDSWLGFHGLEFILFRDGKNRTVKDFQGLESASEFRDSGVDGKLELDFAWAVAGDLRDHTYRLEVNWNENAPQARKDRVQARGWSLMDEPGYYTGYALTHPASGMPYTSARGAISTILNSGCMNIAQEVADQKMGQVWRTATGQGTTNDSQDYIESPYSHKSFQDFYDNIISIQNALYGNIEEQEPNERSIMAYLEQYNPDLATALQEGLDASFQRLNTCMQGRAFVEVAYSGTAEELDNVAKAMKAINQLNEALNEADYWIQRN